MWCNILEDQRSQLRCSKRLNMCTELVDLLRTWTGVTRNAHPSPSVCLCWCIIHWSSLMYHGNLSVTVDSHDSCCLSVVVYDAFLIWVWCFIFTTFTICNCFSKLLVRSCYNLAFGEQTMRQVNLMSSSRMIQNNFLVIFGYVSPETVRCYLICGWLGVYFNDIG